MITISDVFGILLFFIRPILGIGILVLLVYILILIFTKLIILIKPTASPLEFKEPPRIISKIYQKFMKLSYIFIPGIGILIWLFILLNDWYQEGTMLDLGIAFLLTLFLIFELSIIWSIKQWHNLKWTVFIPTLLSILFLLIWQPPTSIENKIIALRLEHNLPQYNQLIDKIQSGKSTEDEYGFIQIPESFPAVQVRIYNTETEGLQILFTTGGIGMGAPAHWGYMYVANENTLQSHDWRKDKIKSHWYWCSD